jgi:hypothetical protein
VSKVRVERRRVLVVDLHDRSLAVSTANFIAPGEGGECHGDQDRDDKYKSCNFFPHFHLLLVCTIVR